MARQSQDSERNGREDGRQQFPFEGLHVYQRAQEAWSACKAAADGDPLGAQIEHEIRLATIGIARATAHSRANGTRPEGGGFSSTLEEARGSLHAAAALIEQRARRGGDADPELRGLLIDGSRMLGALIRTVSQRGEPIETEAVV